ncbi:MAG TPA: prolyl oligopeptidase family serine peptidase, partial [Thermoanaerobaculia bacterium]|nr:prolyl oligopeptidase family serine peptidase [Thermoanaerobaculia bacterium]
KRAFLPLALLAATTALAQTPPPDVAKALESHDRGTDRAFEDTLRAVDDALWYFKLGDVANIQKYRIASSKPRREKNTTSMSAGNMLVIPVYVFAPKNLSGKAPMLVFAHGGVHGRLDTNYTHIFREALERGFVIVSPEYRGSIGHGGDLYSQIDYGGAEIDDTHDARNWAVENLPYVDASRVGIFGWSHGGFHALMNVLNWPDDYKVAYAGVPVSDLVARMGYTGQDYRDTFEEFIGKQPEDNVMEFRRRSPVYHAAKLQTPLLIHTTTNDDDVHVLEVEHLIAALKAAGKKFEYKIYDAAPGAHVFNRIDTKLAKESRREMWEFLARHLK